MSQPPPPYRNNLYIITLCDQLKKQNLSRSGGGFNLTTNLSTANSGWVATPPQPPYFGAPECRILLYMYAYDYRVMLNIISIVIHNVRMFGPFVLVYQLHKFTQH